MERAAAAAAHQLQSCLSIQSCSNLMKSNDEASSLVAGAGEQSWEGFSVQRCERACVSLSERGTERKSNSSLGEDAGSTLAPTH